MVKGCADFSGSHVFALLFKKSDRVIRIDNFDLFYSHSKKMQHD